MDDKQDIVNNNNIEYKLHYWNLFYNDIFIENYEHNMWIVKERKSILRTKYWII